MKTGIWALGIAGMLALAGTAVAQDRGSSRVGFGAKVGSYRNSGGGSAGGNQGGSNRGGGGAASGGNRGGGQNAGGNRGGGGGSGRGGSDRGGSRGGSSHSGGGRNNGHGGGGWGHGGHHGGWGHGHHDSHTSVSIGIGTGFGFGSYYGGYYGNDYYCDPIIVRRPIYVDPMVVERPVVIERPVVVVDPPRADPAPLYITQEESCWRALATGHPDAMEMFGDLMSRGNAPGMAELGYTICAAAAGQVERAEWAASEALQIDAEIGRKVPQIPGLKDQIVSALNNYTSLATERTPQRAQTIALLKEAIGDKEGADQARAAMVRLQEYAAAKQPVGANIELASSK